MSETPAHYQLCVDGNNVEVDDTTKALSYFAAIEYLLRAPFKGQEKEDLRKCITVIQAMIDAPQYQ